MVLDQETLQRDLGWEEWQWSVSGGRVQQGPGLGTGVKQLTLSSSQGAREGSEMPLCPDSLASKDLSSSAFSWPSCPSHCLLPGWNLLHPGFSGSSSADILPPLLPCSSAWTFHVPCCLVSPAQTFLYCVLWCHPAGWGWMC